jgi:hypothetical protein
MDVRREQLEYDVFLAHRSVTRLRGYAQIDDGVRAWTLIEKSTEGPHRAVPYLTANGTRELEAYRSGLLASLAPAVRAPRAYGAVREDDGRIVLWLEDIVHEGSRPLDPASLLGASSDLGALAGTWHRRDTSAHWLFTGWIDRHSQPEAVARGLETLRGAPPAVVARLGTRLPAAERLVLAQPRLRHILEALPQTLCHHDAVGANVFSTGGGTTLIDWESIGPGPVGADLASLLCSSVRRGDARASVVVSHFDEAFDAYSAGVRQQDASISIDDVRRGLDAAIALRWKLIADLAASIAQAGAIRRGSLPDEPPEQALEELIALADVVLGSAERVLDA